MNTPMQCGFCYPREQGTHGEVKREYSPEWRAMIPVCRKHSLDALETKTKETKGQTDEYDTEN